MAISLSLVAIFGLVLIFLLRDRSLTVTGAVVSGGFGFFLASTGAAGPINQMTSALVDAIPNL
ncbi:hypothetical protein CIB93_28290 [Streptomyces sp. WZ.A104]|uniref:hypothetical protein n=1 Tax=Streptomyces sp. WZ.A104 TaxID=2023771 RepID=UPI000BBB757C|nr:hypothetical protein [Streptomyces sp. WZ.A104]PCG82731.1 hypothetical protein CIB93_28290 [Streptomyces sp. WZ.A104]